MNAPLKNLDWGKSSGLIPTIIQSSINGQILMLGFMNRAALAKTLRTKKVWFYSRSKKRLWMKGEVSGNTLTLDSLSSDCDGDTILITATPKGPTCHTGQTSCFRTLVLAYTRDPFAELFATIADRKKKMPANSYTASLVRGGLSKICAKVCEESLEVIKAAQQESKQRVIEESVDVLYHLFVLLTARGVRLNQIVAEIRGRQSK